MLPRAPRFFLGLLLAGTMLPFRSAIASSIYANNAYSYLAHSKDYTYGPETAWLTSDPYPSAGNIFQGWITCATSVTLQSGIVTFDMLGDMLGNIGFASASCCLKVLNELRWRTLANFSTNGQLYSQASGAVGQPGTLRFCAGAAISCTLTTVQGPSGEAGLVTLDGCGNKVILSGQLAVGTNATLVLKNMRLVVQTTTPFSFSANDGRIVLQDVAISLSGNLGGATVSFDASGSRRGILSIKGNVSINGYGQSFDFNTDSTSNTSSSALYIDDNSTLRIGHGVNFTVSGGGAVATRRGRIYLKGASSTLHLDGCTFTIPTTRTSPGIQLERGVLLLSNRTTVANDGNQVATRGLVLGDGSSGANDVICRILSGARVNVNGFLYHNPA